MEGGGEWEYEYFYGRGEGYCFIVFEGESCLSGSCNILFMTLFCVFFFFLSFFLIFFRGNWKILLELDMGLGRGVNIENRNVKKWLSSLFGVSIQRLVDNIR